MMCYLAHAHCSIRSNPPLVIFRLETGKVSQGFNVEIVVVEFGSEVNDGLDGLLSNGRVGVEKPECYLLEYLLVHDSIGDVTWK